MKKTNQLINRLLILAMLSTMGTFAQEEAPARPVYITVMTAHWNMDYENFDMDTWKAVEKEYFDKVTSKNELVMGSGVYLHRFTPDNRELLVVNTYGSWEDIDKAGARNAELEKEAWPDEEARKAYFKKRNAYYADYHSDEIYTTMDHAKPTDQKTTEILLVRRSHFKFPEDGSQEEFMGVFKEYVENVFHKNDLIKGYYPNAHFWGSDRTEFAEAFLVNSMADLDAMFDRNGELFDAHYADEAAKKQMTEMQKKYFTGVHGDYIYTVVPELIK